MKVPSKITVAASALALGLTPAAALAQSSPTHGKSTTAPGHNRTSTTTSSSTSTTPPSQAKEYGRLCQNQSKKHVAGTKGTPFSKCVTDMAHAAKHPKMKPQTACANESKKHVAGQKGTPYSDCIKAAVKLRNQTKSSSTSTSTSTSTTGTSGS